MVSRILLLLALAGFSLSAQVPQVTKTPPLVCDTRKTTNGKCCVFPFTYLGETFYDCTNKNLGVDWCATTADYTSNSNKWGQCEKAPKPIFDVILETNNDKNETKQRFDHARGVIQRAMNHWMAKVPCLKFVPYRSGMGKYLSFFSGGGCYSMVGRQGNSGAQRISIGRGCEQLGVVAHEIGHALGFWHEQSRPDRDSYVTINWQNIQQGVAFNFHKYDAGKINSRGVSYDYNSLMHYSSTAFANRRGVYTIVGKDGRTNLGQRYGLSDKDIIQANKLYCGGAPNTPAPPTPAPATPPPATPPPPSGCKYQDYHRWCPYWESKGYCTDVKHSTYMRKSCQKSCECKKSSQCKDKFQDCQTWKQRGYCNNQSKYSAYVRVYCKASCNSC